jgi:hypothetical protein
LFVKVVPNWRENPHSVRELDWHAQLEAIGNAAAVEGGGEDLDLAREDDDRGDK